MCRGKQAIRFVGENGDGDGDVLGSDYAEYTREAGFDSHEEIEEVHVDSGNEIDDGRVGVDTGGEAGGDDGDDVHDERGNRGDSWS